MMDNEKAARQKSELRAEAEKLFVQGANTEKGKKEKTAMKSAEQDGGQDIEP